MSDTIRDLSIEIFRPVMNGMETLTICGLRHIHLRQKETFEVEQGVLGVVKNGVEYAIKPGDGPVSITPGVRCVLNPFLA